MLIVLAVAIAALIIWIVLAPEESAKARMRSIAWLVAQVCALATALHYMSARF